MKTVAADARFYLTPGAYCRFRDKAAAFGSVQKLAAKAKVPLPALQGILFGVVMHPRVSVMSALCDALGISLDDLINGARPPAHEVASAFIAIAAVLAKADIPAEEREYLAAHYEAVERHLKTLHSVRGSA